jgi:coenzyme F420-reducing hydrogenase alpha subunit
MSSAHAIENAFGVDMDEQLRALRRLLYCGEWIESHALHIYLLHAPDFLGYQDGIQMSKDHPSVVQRGLRLKKTGNDIVSLVGGREIHPINVRVGGFFKLPTKAELQTLVERLEWAREAALETVRFTAALPFPVFEQEYQFVALRHPTDYPMNEGRIVSNKGLDIPVSEYEKHFHEEHREHSNALHSYLKDHSLYFVGPLARYNLNFDRLTPLAQDAALSAGLSKNCSNPFKGIVVRAVETLYACEEALRIIGNYTAPEAPSISITPKASTGYGCTEAPRGILYHRYKIDERGMIVDAKIVPPTAQNQGIIQEDLRMLVSQNLHLPNDALTWQCEQAIRNYDPCISCATHFLKLEIDRE